jgi:trigger factor
MDVSVKDLTEVEKEIHVNIKNEELLPYFDKAYKEYASKVEIKGFRKGKAPLHLVKSMFGESIEYGSLDTVASDIFRAATNERNIRPIGDPTLTDIDYQRGQFLTFNVKYEIRPEFELKIYKGLKFEKIIHAVTDKEIDEEILRLRKSHSTMENALSADDEEHVITSDIQQIDETGNPLIGKKDSDVRIYLASETIYPEMKDTLLKSKTGDVKRVKLEREHESKKETNIIDVTVKKVEKVLLPEFDDELVKKISKDKITGTAEFRANLRRDIENYWHEQSDRKLTETITSEIVRSHEFMVPESLVKSILDSFIDDLKNRYPEKKLPPEFKEEEYREKNKSYAIFQARWFLIREKIIKAENISVEEKDLATLAETESPRYNIEKERLIEFYKSSKSVQERILSDKLMSFLRENSKITEKSSEDFNI